MYNKPDIDGLVHTFIDDGIRQAPLALAPVTTISPSPRDISFPDPDDVVSAVESSGFNLGNFLLQAQQIDRWLFLLVPITANMRMLQLMRYWNFRLNSAGDFMFGGNDQHRLTSFFSGDGPITNWRWEVVYTSRLDGLCPREPGEGFRPMDFASYSTAFAFLAQRGSVFDVQAQEQPPCSGGVYTLLSSDQPGHPQIAATILPNFKTPFFRIYDPSSRSNVRVRWSIGGLVY